MNTLYRFPIRLTIQGPILTKSTSPSSFGLDAAVARDFMTRRPMLPGTLVEGKVREALWRIGEGARLNELFGCETKDDTGNEPNRGALLIGDLMAERDRTEGKGNGDVNRPIDTLSRIALDSTLGSAKAEMLRVIETPFLAGDGVAFEGLAEMFCKDDNAAREITRLLTLGLSWLVQMGAQRSTGFGQLLKVGVSSGPVEVEPIVIATAPVALLLAITPLGPLCIARHKIGDNLFESEDFIPGNMLAGAVMETAVKLGIQSDFQGQFDSIRFRHSFPSSSSVRAVVLADSTVKIGDTVYDVAVCRDPVLLTGEDGKTVAPAFPIDWKESCGELAELGHAFPSRELRVRTSIDSERRKSADAKLFAWEMIHPFDNDRKPIVWRTRIDLGAVKDDAKRKAVAQTLAKILARLSFVSKTKARCEVAVTPLPQAETAPELRENGTIALVLQSPTLLADPRFQEVINIPKSGALSAAEMLALYRDAFAELSGESLDLSHHFARQFLAGGNYLAHRFQKKSGKPYDPWLLTAAGAVFVFTVKDAAKAQTRIESWLNNGLPVPHWAKSRFGDSWMENPFRPENGFAEVALHRPAFATPETQDFTLADSILKPLS